MNQTATETRATRREYRRLARLAAARHAAAEANGLPAPTRKADAAALSTSVRTLTRAVAWCRAHPAPEPVAREDHAPQVLADLDRAADALETTIDRLGSDDRAGAAHELTAAIKAMHGVHAAQRGLLAELAGESPLTDLAALVGEPEVDPIDLPECADLKADATRRRHDATLAELAAMPEAERRRFAAWLLPGEVDADPDEDNVVEVLHDAVEEQQEDNLAKRIGEGLEGLLETPDGFNRLRAAVEGERGGSLTLEETHRPA